MASRVYELESAGKTEHSVNRGLLYAIFRGWRNKIRVYADGERMNFRRLFLCTLSNGRWVAGRYRCAPDADPEETYRIRAVDGDGNVSEFTAV